MLINSHYGALETAWPPQEGRLDNINPYPHEVNITDGSEFLDDAIRTRDQPLGEQRIQNSEFRIRNSE